MLSTEQSNINGMDEEQGGVTTNIWRPRSPSQNPNSNNNNNTRETIYYRLL